MGARTVKILFHILARIPRVMGDLFVSIGSLFVSSELIVEVWKKRKLITRQIATLGNGSWGIISIPGWFFARNHISCIKKYRFPELLHQVGVYTLYPGSFRQCPPNMSQWMEKLTPCIPMRASPFRGSHMTHMVFPGGCQYKVWESHGITLMSS